MIKKRYLMILSLAIVSVLFGSLLYNNITLAEKLRTYKDSVEITVLDWTARYKADGEYGIDIQKHVFLSYSIRN